MFREVRRGFMIFIPPQVAREIQKLQMCQRNPVAQVVAALKITAPVLVESLVWEIMAAPGREQQGTLGALVAVAPVRLVQTVPRQATAEPVQQTPLQVAV
jgi:hypothetical protein